MPIKGVHQTSHYVPVHNQLHKTGSYFLENENAHMAIFQLNYNYNHPNSGLSYSEKLQVLQEVAKFWV